MQLNAFDQWRRETGDCRLRRVPQPASRREGEETHLHRESLTRRWTPFISCPEVPLLWRVLAWIWRHSWGNSSDFCVDKIGGKPQGQQECADEFGVAKQRINDCVSLLRDLYFVLPSARYMLYPVDDPAHLREEKANASPAPSGLPFASSSPFEEYCKEWQVRHLAEFQELESAEGTLCQSHQNRPFRGTARG